MKHRKRKAIAATLIIVTLSITIFTGCDTLLQSLNEEIVLGQLSDVNNGKLLIHVELKKRINAWYIIIGEPRYPDKMKKLGDRLLNKTLKVSIVNRTNIEVKFKGHDGPIRILPNEEKVWYSGTLSYLIFRQGAIVTSNYFGDQPCKYDIKLEFEDKDIKINRPATIGAYRHWK